MIENLKMEYEFQLKREIKEGKAIEFIRKYKKVEEKKLNELINQPPTGKIIA